MTRMNLSGSALRFSMEVTCAQSCHLTNYEVLQLCRESRQGRADNKINNLSTVLYETCKYLEDTPSSSQTPEVLEKLAGAVAEFALTKAELLQLINLRPTTPVEIQLVVEECEERLTEDQVDALIAAIEEHLPPPQPPTVQTNKTGGGKAKKEKHSND